MSRSSSIDEGYYVKVDSRALALQYDKPVEYVQLCLDKHRVEVLPRYRTAGDGFAEFYSDLTAFVDGTPSMTKQEFTDEVDINTIVKRFINSGGDPTSLPFTNSKAMYGDFTNVPDSYQSALNYVIDTKNEFMKLPADVRARFDNSPQLFLDYVANPSNLDELIKMGLAVKSDSNTPSDVDRIVSAIEASNAAKSSKKGVRDLLKRMSDSVGDEGDD